MEIKAPTNTTEGPKDMFTGDVYIDVIARGEEPSRVRVNIVRFAPGSHTAWHAHAVGQTLHVTEGLGVVSVRGTGIMVIHPGDTIYTPANQWHWHGAAPGHFMTHLAIWEAPAPGTVPESEWGDHVSDEDYKKAKEVVS